MARKCLEISAVTLLMLILAVVSTYPLILNFDTAIPYAGFGGPEVWNRSGDQIQLMYWFWLVKENFMGAVEVFNSNPYEFNMLVPHDSSGMNTVPLAFLYMLFSPFGDIAAYNCTIISSYVLAGLFMYLLVKLYSGSRAGALLGAIVFTFAPSRINGFAAGHGYGLLYFCYPFILYFLEKGIRSGRIIYGVLYGVFSGLGLIFLAMVEPHLIYYICVFLGMYIPFRILAFLPYQQGGGNYSADGGTVSWPAGLSLLLLWGAGCAAVVYSQVFLTTNDPGPFFTPFFWYVLILYPVIPILLAICFASLYQRFSSLGFQQGLAVEAGSYLPLYLLLPLAVSLIILKGGSIETGIVISAAASMIIILKLVLLRNYLLPILRNLFKGLVQQHRKIWPAVPLVLSMGGIVYWMVSSKVHKIASTIAGGGRTLTDVKLFSSQLTDIFSPVSNIYVGIFPNLLIFLALLSVIVLVLRNNKYEKFEQEDDLLSLFYITIIFCCYLLALGLAFNTLSLYSLFYHYFPFFNYPRVSDRIITLVLFGMAVLTGFAVKKIHMQCSAKICRGIVILLVLAAAGFQLKDYNVFKPMGINILDKGQDVYTYVKKNIGDGLLLEIPLWPGDSHQSSLYQHYIMLDKVKRVNGSSPMVLRKYIETVFDPLGTINQGKLNRQQYELLLQLGVNFITVHNNRDIFTDKVSPFEPLTTVRRLKNSPFLEYIDIDNTMYFKEFEKKNNRLHLFRVKSMEEVGDDDASDQAWYTMPSIYDATKHLRQQTGRIVKDAELAKGVVQATGADKPGYLVYGPYVVYPPGDYHCFFRIRTDGRTRERVALLEVSNFISDKEVDILASKEISGSTGSGDYQYIPLDFSLAGKKNLEFRVFYYGGGEVLVDQIAVFRVGDEKPLYLLEAEKMVGKTGQLQMAADASGGKVIECLTGKDGRGEMVYGPNRIYDRGRYKARFYLRGQKGKNISNTAAAAVLSVTDAQGYRTFARRAVTAEELSDKKFTGMELDFVLDRGEELSFQVRFMKTVNLQVDKIEIIRQ